MSKKYELVESSKIISRNVILYRIKALVDIPNIVKAGELGGYVESWRNLLVMEKAGLQTMHVYMVMHL